MAGLFAMEYEDVRFLIFLPSFDNDLQITSCISYLLF